MWNYEKFETKANKSKSLSFSKKWLGKYNFSQSQVIQFGTFVQRQFQRYFQESCAHSNLNVKAFELPYIPDFLLFDYHNHRIFIIEMKLNIMLDTGKIENMLERLEKCAKSLEERNFNTALIVFCPNYISMNDPDAIPLLKRMNNQSRVQFAGLVELHNLLGYKEIPDFCQTDKQFQKLIDVWCEKLIN